MAKMNLYETDLVSQANVSDTYTRKRRDLGESFVITKWVAHDINSIKKE